MQRTQAASRYASVQVSTTPRVHPDPESALIEKHGPLLQRVLRSMVARTGAHQHSGDMWTAGALALVDAWSRFDAQQNASFETFARHRIRGAMLDELRRIDHLPRRLRQKTEQLRKKRASLGAELGREPERAELAEALEVGLDELETLEGLSKPVCDVEDHLAGLVTLPDVENGIDRQELLDRMAESIRQLPERLQMVLGLRYTEGLTLREIAGLLSVSEPRVSQLHSEAVKKLRAQLL